MRYLASNLRLLIPVSEQNRVADQAKVSQSWLNRVMNPDREDGIKQPRDTTLLPLANYLGYDIATLKNVDLAQNDAEQTISGQSQLSRPPIATILAALDFLEESFAARDKVYDRNQYPLLLAAVVDDLMRPDPPSVIQLSVKYGGTIDAGTDWDRNKAASAG